jgi:hypothetical protein
MSDEDRSILEEIVGLALRGEDLLDKGIIDIAFDQFIDIRKLAKKILGDE